VPGTHGSEGQAPASEGPGSGERPEREAPSAEFAEPRGRGGLADAGSAGGRRPPRC